MSKSVDSATRSKIMSSIKSKDTFFEIKVRQYLYKNGFRFRKNYSKLPGTPDIYLTKNRIAIFINGCFWHGHLNCGYFKLPKSNIDFWSKKIEDNRYRDQRNIENLNCRGITTIIIWECELKEDFDKRMTTLIESIEDIRHTCL